MDESPSLDELTRLYKDHIAGLEKAYAKVLAEKGWEGVAIHSGSAKLRSAYDDVYWPLRVTPHFQHWLPLVLGDSLLLVVPGKRPVLYRNTEPNFWEAPMEPETGHFWKSFDLVDVPDPAKLAGMLPKSGRIAFLGEERERAAALGFGDRLAPPELVKALDALRTIKSPYEVLCLREANRRAALGHAAVAKAFRDGDESELRLHLLYLETTRQDDPETPYKNIVALGEHAATLHHIGYSRKKSAAQALLLDAGATYQGYASDVTRTYVKGKGHAADVFGGLISKMEALQQEMCRRAKPGIPYQELHNQSHQLLAPVLRELGIAKASDAELVDGGVTRTFLPHGLGHSLGLQTHDVGCAVVKPEPRNPFLRNTSTVTPSQVFTIEPGCYFIPALLDELKAKPAGKTVDWTLVDQLKAFGGVRIEDDLVVQESGARNLTREALP